MKKAPESPAPFSYRDIPGATLFLGFGGSRSGGSVRDAEFFFHCGGDVGKGSLVEIGERTRRSVEYGQIAACGSHFVDRVLGLLDNRGLAIATCVLAVFFTSASYPELCAALEHAVPEETMAKLRLFRGGVMASLARWLRAQATLSCITFFELLLGFLLMHQDYALLLAFLITLLDALPVFGTGTALVPWAVFTLLFGFPPKAIVLLALYLCTLITRNTLEPKLISAQAGLPPIASLFAMYLGYCTFGVAGMVLFPFFLLLLSQIRKNPGSKTA